MRCVVDHCITCSDEGVPVTIVRLDRATGLADCEDAGGAPCEVDTSLVGDVGPGDRVLAHAGVALTRLEGAGA